VASQLGEWLRRAALGLAAALLTARAFFPGEDAESGSGLLWVAGILLAAGLGIAGLWLAGVTRLRRSWVDVAFLVLVALVGLSTSVAADRRAAISVAWDWAGLAVAYLVLRNLPRHREESATLTGAWLATAIALSTYGLYQVVYEFPLLKQRYLQNPNKYLAEMAIDPNSSTRQALESRLLGSKEPIATFALANSLAGVLVGAAVVAFGVGLENVLRREGRGPRFVPLVLAAAPLLMVLGCLELTKSRSAYLGLLVGLAVLAWRERARVTRRALVLGGAAVAGLLLVLAALGVAAGQLDRQVLTESTKSLGYRSEYWTATWKLITSTPRTFTAGVGPGNFAGPYLRYKLPESSEEIVDPHNMVLDVWATSGVLAAAALVVTLALALRDTLGPPRVGSPEETESETARGRPVWLWFCAWSGVLLVVGLGKINPFEGEGLSRWLALAVGWAWGAAMFWPLWRRRPIPGAALGMGALAVMVNLLGAGGIAMPPVALGLWALIALGQDLRDDRPASQLRAVGGRWWAFGLALVFAALAGSFVGSNLPHWRAEAVMAEAELALHSRKQPDARLAIISYMKAAQADRYSARPYLAWANLLFLKWQYEQAIAQRVWSTRIAPVLDEASAPPRNPNALSVQRARMAILRELIARQGRATKDLPRMQNDLVNAAAKAVKLYPNNASLHAELAEAAAAIGRFDLAAREAREALRLDRLTPHQDKKLPDAERKRLREQEPVWAGTERQP
jgi:O-antigen ligase